jgi:hypothetical protein
MCRHSALSVVEGQNLRIALLSVLACHSERSEESPHLLLSVLRCCLFYAVILSGAARVLCELRSRRTPTKLILPIPPTPFSPQTPAHSSSLTAHSRNKKIAVAYPQKPQQIRLSSPSTPKNPTSSHSINHFPPKNSWHSSYAPLGRIEVWIEFKAVILAQPTTCRHPDRRRCTMPP